MHIYSQLLIVQDNGIKPFDNLTIYMYNLKIQGAVNSWLSRTVESKGGMDNINTMIMQNTEHIVYHSKDFSL